MEETVEFQKQLELLRETVVADHKFYHNLAASSEVCREHYMGAYLYTKNLLLFCGMQDKVLELNNTKTN